MDLVNNSNYIVEEFTHYNPLTQRYAFLEYWREHKRRCVEGYWSSGQWMPGPLYYYINFHPIQVENKRTGGQVLARPFLRDIDWELLRIYEECRGFSGWENLKGYTALREYGPDRERAELLDYDFDPDLEYMSAREMLRTNWGKNLGKPLYENKAKNFISIQARGGGKSYATSGIVAHNYLFAGATDYDYYLNQKRIKEPLASETMVGAITSTYSGQLLDKVRTGMENLRGSFKANGKDYASPIFEGWAGGWGSGKYVKSKTTGSKIYHRTFHDDPLAGNGTRANLFALDEIGFFTNIIEAWGAIEGGEESKQFKRQVIWALGTGGLIGGSAALYAETIFRNPDQFNCVEFEDIFENGNKPIGYFVPITKTLNEFKEGENLVTNEEKALRAIEYDRKQAEKNINKEKLLLKVINAPLTPSEAFLSVESTEFPGMLIKEQLSNILGNPNKYILPNWVGHLKLSTEDGSVYWEDDHRIQPIRDFPITDNADKSGAIEIYEKPRFDWPVHNPYIAGADTVDKAKSTTPSLFSCFVFNRWTREIVAEYTGRTDDPNDAYEKVRRLCLYYNCKVMYEQQVSGIFPYFDGFNQTYLLADTPSAHRNKKTFVEGTNTSKGINATASVNKGGRQMLSSWMKKPQNRKNPDVRMVHTIKSVPLLKECLMWNPDGNFDRVSAMIQVMWYDQSLYNLERYTEEELNQRKSFIENKYFNKFKQKKNQNELLNKSISKAKAAR